MSKPGIANPEHAIAFDALNKLLQEMVSKHNLSALELLAIASNMVGKLIAMQDGKHVSPDRAMRIVSQNIQIGNAEILARSR